MENRLENIGFIIKVILDVIDLAFPNHKLNLLANEEKNVLKVKIMDECHQIYRLNSNVNVLNTNTLDSSNINTKEG
jgi:hypothetical protein